MEEWVRRRKDGTHTQKKKIEQIRNPNERGSP